MASNLPKPTIVLVPGAWHSSSTYNALRPQLEARGYPTESVSHPSISPVSSDPRKTLVDDAKNLSNTLLRLADAGRELIVVLHSYGGLVGGNAVEGLLYQQRKREGKTGGVLALVYIAAFALPKGQSLRSFQNGQAPKWQRFEGDVSYVIDPEDIFYNDMSSSESAEHISQLLPTSIANTSLPATYEPWHHIPCVYIHCARDRAIPPNVQEICVRVIGDATVLRLDASHSPHLSMPGKVVDCIEVAVQEGLAKAHT